MTRTISALIGAIVVACAVGPAPGPGTLAMIGTGLLGILGYEIRRRITLQ